MECGSCGILARDIGNYQTFKTKLVIVVFTIETVTNCLFWNLRRLGVTVTVCVQVVLVDTS